MATPNEGLPDFEGFFDDEWVDEQIEVGNCVVGYIYFCLYITSELLSGYFLAASLEVPTTVLGPGQLQFLNLISTNFDLKFMAKLCNIYQN